MGRIYYLNASKIRYKYIKIYIDYKIGSTELRFIIKSLPVIKDILKHYLL